MSTSIEYYLNKRDKCYSTTGYGSITLTYSSYVKQQEIINWYLEARHVEKIQMTFSDFEILVKKKMGTYRYNHKWRRTGHRFTPKNSFRREKHHKKKELSEKEIAKREWRKKKKHRKDQHSYWCYKGVKADVNKQRRSERRNMKMDLRNKDWDNGYWDDFNELDRGSYCAKWDWY